MEQVKNRTDKLKINVILNVIYNVFLVITPLFTAPYASRVLQPDGIGIYSYSNSLVTYFTVFAALGTVTYGTRKIARHRNNKKEYSKDFWEIELMTIFTSLISLSAWILLSVLYTEYKVFLLILSFQIVATAFDISWLYAGLEKYKYTVLINSLAKLTGIILIFTLVKSKADLNIYIIINVGVHLLGNISMWIFLPKTTSKTKIEISSIKHHLKETLVYFIPTIATILYSILDKTLIGALVQGTIIKNIDGKEITTKISELENGYYEQATSIITMIKTISFVAINGVMMSRSSFLFKENKVDEVKTLTKKTYDLTLFLSIGAMFGLMALAQLFVPIFFGEGYDKTVLLIYVLAPIIMINCLSSVLGSLYYTPSGRRKQSAIYIVCGTTVNLVLSIPLILFLNSIGAAVASIIAEIVITVLYILRCNKFISIKELFSILWKKIIAGGMMFIAVFFFSNYVGKYIPWWLSITISIIIGLAIYVLINAILKDNSISYIMNLIRNKLKRNKGNN